MFKTINIGKIGENIACAYLGKNGYAIIDRNYKTKFGEIDIIAKYIDKTLIFFEVKTIDLGNHINSIDLESFPHNIGNIISKAGYKMLRPEDNMTESKINKFRRISSS